jgi:Na+/melibiose symporter-like transporter
MVLSPIIGGVMAYLLGWRWAFNINVPICILLAAAVAVFVDESRDADARRLDPVGILSFSASMFGLTWGLINGQAVGWNSMSAIYGFCAGALASVVFIVAENVQERPMLDLKLFRFPRFVGAVLAMFAYAGCAQVMASLLPLFLQNGLGRTPLAAGFAMLPFALAMLALPYVGRRLSGFLTPSQLLSLGLALVAVGNAITGWGAHLGASTITMCGMVALGSGGGLLNGETQKAIMSVVPRERAGMASGISTTSRFAGILLGFAVLSGVIAAVARNFLIHASCAGGHPCNYTTSFADAVVAGDFPRALAGLTGAQGGIAMTHARLAYAAAFGTALFAAALVAGVSAVAVHLLMGKRAGNWPPAAPKM